MVILDNSGSITRLDSNNWNYMLAYTKAVAERITLGVKDYQLSVLLFGNSGRLKISLDQTYSNAELASLIDSLNFQAQRTNLEDGLLQAREQGFSTANGARTGAYQVAIVVYDGEPPNEDFGGAASAMVEASKMRDSGVEVFVYTLKNYIESNETSISLINAMGSFPLDEHVFVMDDWQGLAALAPTTLTTITSTCQGNSSTSALSGSTGITRGIR